MEKSSERLVVCISNKRQVALTDGSAQIDFDIKNMSKTWGLLNMRCRNFLTTSETTFPLVNTRDLSRVQAKTSLIVD